MSGQDGSGPDKQGPLTVRRAGKCNNNNQSSTRVNKQARVLALKERRRNKSHRFRFSDNENTSM